MKKTKEVEKYLIRKRLLGLALGLVLAIIVLNVDKKLWWPLELETTNSRNTRNWLVKDKLSTKDIVVILFDDKTQFLLRQHGMPIKDFEKKGRDLINVAIQKLEASHVRAIGINLNLNSSSETKSDEKLASTISKYKNIVIADSINSILASSSNKILKRASSIGYGELYADYDRIVHKIKLVDKGYRDIQSFSYALYKVAARSDVPSDLKNRNEFFLKYSQEPVIKYSFIDLIQGKINPTMLSGKIVVLGLGLNSKLIREQLLNPYEKDSFTSGSEVQATSLANLLSKSYLFNFSFDEYPLHFIILSVILGTIFSSIPIFRGFIIALVLFIVQVLISHLAYDYHQILLDIVPLSFILLGNFVIGSLIFLQLNLQEQNLELAEALTMLSLRGNELENSQKQLENKNIQLSSALTELHKKVNELKEVRKQLSGRSEEERKRIARELHDDTLARVTDLRICIESMLSSKGFPLNEKRQLGGLIQILDNVTCEVRRIINALRPSMLDNVLGLIPAIESLLDELSGRSNHKIQTKLTTSISRLKLSESDEINLYRIIQESLNNVFKHSNATKVEIIIDEQPGQVLFLVRDNGVGLSSDSGSRGFGLVDMNERAELIGASLQYLNKPAGTGVTLEITIPISKIIKIEKISFENEVLVHSGK
ncbi:MAG: CHASE2 domain-containing protein [Candidatus Melainabacteria bacterium]|nr:CHASE2 domain-containing protein [Candidatus Melainabacteria bacterium]